MSEDVKYYLRFTFIFAIGFLMGVLVMNNADAPAAQQLEALIFKPAMNVRMQKHELLGPDYAQTDLQRYVRTPAYKDLAPAFARGIGAFVFPNGQGLYRVLEMDIYKASASKQ